jgi:nucleoside-diphosphate-sugar epimerase
VTSAASGGTPRAGRAQTAWEQAGARPRTYLVTGGAGFIGASLVRALEARGDGVRVIDSLAVGTGVYLDGTRAQILTADLVDPGAAEQAVQDVDGIFHLAAQAGVPQSIAAPYRDMEQNLVATVRLLEAAREAGVERVIVASSNAAVGLSEVQPVHEGLLPHPVSPYGAAKAAIEGYLIAYAEAYAMTTTAIRFSNSYGPYALHKVSVVAAFMKALLGGQSLRLYGDGSQTRDFVHVDDIVAQLLLTADAPEEVVRGQVFQAGSGRETTVRELAETLLEVSGISTQIEYLPPRSGDVQRSASDIGKASRLLGYGPRVELADGLRRTVDWFRAALADPALASLAVRPASGSD